MYTGLETTHTQTAKQSTDRKTMNCCNTVCHHLDIQTFVKEWVALRSSVNSSVELWWMPPVQQVQSWNRGTSIMFEWKRHSLLSHILWTVPPGRLKHWACCQPMSRSRTAVQSCHIWGPILPPPQLRSNLHSVWHSQTITGDPLDLHTGGQLTITISTAEDLQFEPHCQESAGAVENIMPGSGAEKGVSQLPIRLQVSFTHLSLREGLTETSPKDLSSLGKASTRSPTIHLSDQDGCGWCHHLPAAPCLQSSRKAWMDSEDYVLWFLQHFLSTRNSSVTVTIHSVHIWFKVHHWRLSSAEVLRWLCDSWMCQELGRGRTQEGRGQFCQLSWAESAAA